MDERMIRIEELAMLLGVNGFTITRWYKFKKENPDAEICKYLPDYIQNEKRVRLWKESDVLKIKEFQEHIVFGRNGYMGSVTHPKKEDKKHGKKKNRINK